MDICKLPLLVWEEYTNPDRIFPRNFTKYIIYLINNNPEYDNIVLVTIDEPSPNECDDVEDPKGYNNRDLLNSADYSCPQ